MGPGKWPETSAGGALSAGGPTIVLITGESSEGPLQCDVADDRSKLIVHRGVSSGGGFSWVDATTLQASVPTENANGSHFLPIFDALDVEPGGNALTSFKIGGTDYLRAFEDPAAPSDGGTPGSGTPGGVTPSAGVPGVPGGGTPVNGGPAGPVAPLVPGTPAAPSPIKPIVARTLAAVPSSISPEKPTVTAVCPPEVADECLYSFVVRTAFGATTRARAAAAKRGPVIGTARATVKPGKRRSVALKLNAAGKTLVKRRRAARVRITMTVRIGSRTFTTTKATTLKAAKRVRR